MMERGAATHARSEWAKRNPDASGLIYFTDLLCRPDRVGEAPPCPVLWAASPGWALLRDQFPAPPFGDVIQIDPNA